MSEASNVPGGDTQWEALYAIRCVAEHVGKKTPASRLQGAIQNMWKIADGALTEQSMQWWENFVPDGAHINALPDKLRYYIHDLETRADPAGDIQAAACASDNAEGLAVLLHEARADINRLQEELNRVKGIKP